MAAVNGRLENNGQVFMGHSYGSISSINSNDEMESLPQSLILPQKSKHFGFCHELKRLLWLAWPITIIQICQYSFGFVAAIFCGQAGTTALDTVALANSAINVIGISVAVGLSSACDTLFAQIYGSPNKKLLGVVVQRSLIVLLLALLPCIAVHINAEYILLMLGQDRAVAKMTGEYLFIFIPGLSSFFIYIVVSKYLMAQNIIYPTMAFGLIANGVNALLHYILMVEYDLDVNGSAYAQSSSYVLMCVLNLGFLFLSGVYKGTWDGWKIDCFSDWGSFFKLALAGLLMLCIEWWALEVGIFLSGVLGIHQLAAMTVLFQYEAIYLMFPIGISVSTSIRIGQYLGAGKIHSAKMSMKVGLVMSSVIGVIFAVVFALGNKELPRLFTSDEKVIAAVENVFYVLAYFAVFDSISNVAGGVLRGFGKQHVGAGIIAVGYLIALSIGVPTMFLTELGIEGFWLGLSSALTLTSLLYIILICRTDWNQMAENANMRSKKIDIISEQNQRNIRAGMPVEVAEPGETSGLLHSYDSDVFADDEEELLMPRPDIPGLRRVSSNMSNPYLDPFPLPELLELERPRFTPAMICYRLLYVLFCLCTFGAGLCCRLLIPAPMIDVITNATTIAPDFNMTHSSDWPLVLR